MGFVRARAMGGVLLAAGLLAAGGLGYKALFVHDARPAEVMVRSSAPTVPQIEKLQELVTLKVHVADVLTGHDEKWYGDVNSVHLIKGDALVAVDLSLYFYYSRDRRGGAPGGWAQTPQSEGAP